ncbi:MAG: OmpA family protein [Cyclobacteriaceae bacterium]
MRCLIIIASLFLVLVAQSQKLSNAAFAKANSKDDEHAPIVSPDGSTLFLTIGHHEQNMAGKKDLGDIWVSVWLGTEWSAPVHGGSQLNNRNYNAVAGISSDGNQLFLLSHYAQTDVGTQGIAVATKTSRGWSFPQNINVPYFLNKSSELSGQVTGDGNIFIYAAEGYGTFGAEDLYISFKSATGRWSEPRNLGRDVNTSFQELSPWLSDDLQYLYFASNGRQGLGSFDIYRSRRLDESWTKWTEPVNLGPEVNSDGRELFFRITPQAYALYTSTKHSDGYGDIKLYWPPEVRDSIQQPVLAARPDTVVRLQELAHEKPAVNPNTVRIFGVVTDEQTNAPIPARVEFKSDTSIALNAAANGTFAAQVPSVDHYSVAVTAPGYIGAVEKLDIRTFEMTELQMNFKLKKAEVGATVNLKNVLFQQSTANLLDESYDELNMVVDFLKSNPNVEIELSGHTDNRGIHNLNVRLSQQRVDQVKQYLVDHGIDKKRITGKGYGGIKPIASNDAEVTRRLNRRVEFTIVKN